MFRSLVNRILDFAEDALAPLDEPCVVADEEPVRADESWIVADDEAAFAVYPAPHPHRRELRWEHERRPGFVPQPLLPCISPVGRRPAGARTRDGSAR